ncbi:MAG: hypothetical protein ABSD03_13135 [Vulcanimicrobiaceae bacterium]
MRHAFGLKIMRNRSTTCEPSHFIALPSYHEDQEVAQEERGGEQRRPEAEAPLGKDRLEVPLERLDDRLPCACKRGAAVAVQVDFQIADVRRVQLRIADDRDTSSR